jgi:hypothetical protein
MSESAVMEYCSFSPYTWGKSWGREVVYGFYSIHLLFTYLCNIYSFRFVPFPFSVSVIVSFLFVFLIPVFVRTGIFLMDQNGPTNRRSTGIHAQNAFLPLQSFKMVVRHVGLEAGCRRAEIEHGEHHRWRTCRLCWIVVTSSVLLWQAHWSWAARLEASINALPSTNHFPCSLSLELHGASSSMSLQRFFGGLKPSEDQSVIHFVSPSSGPGLNHRSYASLTRCALCRLDWFALSVFQGEMIGYSLLSY